MIPFLLITFLLLFIFNVDWFAYIGHFLQNTLNSDMVFHKDFFILVVLGGINALIAFLVWNYSQMMYIHMNLKYIGNKKAHLLKFEFFNPKLFWMYVKVSALLLSILSLPILIGGIGHIILILFSGGVNATGVEFTNGNILLIAISRFIFIISLIGFLYLSYRGYFSYVVFIEDWIKKYDFKTAGGYIKKSYALTKGVKKLFKLIVALFVFALVLTPITFLDNGLNNTYRQIRDYHNFSSLSQEEKGKIYDEKPYYYAQLQTKYSHISQVDLVKNIQIYYYLIWSFNIVTFLLIGGLMEMVMVSFYKRKLT